MKTIFQLAKLSRRIPNRIRRFAQKRDKAKSPAAAKFFSEQIIYCENATRRLIADLDRRNINGPAKRDTETPAKKSWRLFAEGLRSAITKRDANL